jgi:hypothetical protein
MKLFMTGGKDFVARKPKPTVIKVKAFLERSKEGELFTTAQVADTLKINHGTLKHHEITSQLKEYSNLVFRQRYWGKPSTIKQLIKETR